MLEPLVVKATRAVPRRERRSNPPDLSNEKGGAILLTYPTLFSQELEKTSKKYLKFLKTTFPREDWYLQKIKLKLHTFLKDLIF